jgi:hypothetical protein
VLVPIRAVGDVRMLLLAVDSVAALDSSRVDIVRVKSVGSLVLVVIDDGCSFYEHLYGSRNFIGRESTRVKQGSCSD